MNLEADQARNNVADESDASNSIQNPPNSPEYLQVRIPHEVATEHLITKKFYVDDQMLCFVCCKDVCREKGKEYYTSVTIHEVATIDKANQLYRFENCNICSIGLLRMFGRRNCRLCRCDACDRLPDRRCDECENNHLGYRCCSRIRRASSL